MRSHRRQVLARSALALLTSLVSATWHAPASAEETRRVCLSGVCPGAPLSTLANVNWTGFTEAKGPNQVATLLSRPLACTQQQGAGFFIDQNQNVFEVRFSTVPVRADGQRWFIDSVKVYLDRAVTKEQEAQLLSTLATRFGMTGGKVTTPEGTFVMKTDLRWQVAGPLLGIDAKRSDSLNRYIQVFKDLTPAERAGQSQEAFLKQPGCGVATPKL